MTTAENSLADQINRLLPQTQCTKCGYQGCRPYAEAIAAGAAINRCPPGGPQTIILLSALTGQPVSVLDPEAGEHLPQKLAVIREDECIGCTKCIQACPVDAIAGSAKRMHTVIASECSGCDLCVEPCPVDCIDMVSIADQFSPPDPLQSQHWQMRYENRNKRLQQEADEHLTRKLLKLQTKQAALAAGENIQRPAATPAMSAAQSPEQLRAYIAAAVARTQARKSALQSAAEPTPQNTFVKTRTGPTHE